MAANPFLFNEEPFASPGSAGSNPFLMDDDPGLDHVGFNDNPFMSQTATTISTNPFSFDPMDLEPAEAEVPTIQNTNNTDPFGDIEPSSTVPFSEPITTQPIIREVFTKADFSQPQKPSELDLKYSHQPVTNGPPRPPPPRPPPSKETQDLLMSVMGAMDATSSSLLNKIPPTRSPSPVSMRDLHSPSPTPEPSFGDLLDVTDKVPEPVYSVTSDLFSLGQDNCDINQNPSVGQETIVQAKPPRPSPPVRPPKPPLPAMFKNTPKDAPQSVPVQKPDEPKHETVEEIDFFGMETPPQKKEVTNADILNLYNVPKQEPAKTDLLFDLMEPDIIMQTHSDMTTPAIPKNIQEVSNVASPLSQTNELTKDNLISSEPSQEDLRMDLSDSHSKGSVSSVTFNPFAPTEDMSQANTPQPVFIEDNFKSEINQNNVQKTMNIFDNTTQILDTMSGTEETFGFSVQETNSTLEDGFRSSSEAAETKMSADDLAMLDTTPVPASLASFGTTDTTVESGDVFGISTKEEVKPSLDNFGPFGSVAEPSNAFEITDNTMESSADAFVSTESTVVDAFGVTSTRESNTMDAFGAVGDDFDDFAKKFDSVKTDDQKSDVWGNSFTNTTEVSSGFGQDDGFDAFLALQEPPSVPQSTPNRISKAPSQESDEDKDFSVFIRPKGSEEQGGGILPTIAPPPAPTTAAFIDTSPRFNPFDNQNDVSTEVIQNDIPYAGDLKRSDSQETPPTPLFDDDVSQPLEPFPRINFTGDGWEMQLRQPNKKKITGQRFWKKIFVKILHQTDCVLLQLYNQKDDKDPFQELPLQPCYSVSDIGAQQYDQFGKIFTVKLQYIFYKERPGVRPGQVKKAERITNKLSQFAAYAIQGDYQGVKEFGSDLKKLGLPVEHAPQVSQLMKLGSLNYEDLKQFSFCIEEALFKLQAHRDRALHYKMEEVQITAVDELHVEQDAEGHIEKQIARVRLFFLGFLTGMPDVELGINDMRRQGKEVVGRHDIIPVVTEEWIRLEEVEFHSCVQQDDYNDTHIIKFKPPDACYIELLRFRVRPPKNRELPLQLKAQICVTGYKVELRADVLVPGFASRKLGQIPCEDVMIRFPIPECWIYLFRVEKHFRYGSVKSAHRRTGKIKGIERILGTVETLQENLIEVTSGQAKYEHQHRAIVWRCPRLPKEGQGAYTTHNMVCRIALTNYDQMPEKLADYCYVEFTMPATQVSHTTCRSVSLQNTDSDEPPEKYVRYLARHEYRVGIEHTEGESPNPYAAATYVSKPTPAPAPAAVDIPAKVAEESSSDSD
nr:protein stoned-B [Leptinotarsa decemlineata]